MYMALSYTLGVCVYVCLCACRCVYTCMFQLINMHSLYGERLSFGVVWRVCVCIDFLVVR